MNFWDGVFLASIFWLFGSGLCFLRGYVYGINDFDIPRFNWSEGWSEGWDAGWKNGVNIGLDHGYNAGFQAARSFDHKEVLNDENA